MPASTHEASGFNLPEAMTWEELDDLPGDIAKDIELWQGRVVWNRRPAMEHQELSVLMRNALKVNAGRAMRDESGGREERCWQVGTETNVFFTPDKSSFLTPDFLVRRCLPRGSETFVGDTVLVGEVLSGSDTPKRRQWKMNRYAEGGIPWYWEVELDSGDTWDVTAVRAYGLAALDQAGLPVKPLRPALYVPVGEWEPAGLGIEFPEPFNLSITWDDLAL
ncbi:MULTISPECIES: Uma2 family endonuclease [unclassified Streptomyces]|uniref:Uma2 family endonuclease n=1 Tax=unclassified Streptomyces TaxID=2593676 RepID=UPI00278C67D6|nr:MULTISPECIES: Uma2 family endonuclease [unclassified Streptomyces]